LEYILRVSYPHRNKEFSSLPRNKAVLPFCEEEDDDCLRNYCLRNYCLRNYCLRNYYSRRNYCSTYCGNDYLMMRKKTYYDDDCSKKIHEGLVVLEVWDGGGGDVREVCDDGGDDDAQVSPVDKVFPQVCGGGGDAWRNCCCCSKNYYYSKKKKKN
jgi:hypothetical protein